MPPSSSETVAVAAPARAAPGRSKARDGRAPNRPWLRRLGGAVGCFWWSRWRSAAGIAIRAWNWTGPRGSWPKPERRPTRRLARALPPGTPGTRPRRSAATLLIEAQLAADREPGARRRPDRPPGHPSSTRVPPAPGPSGSTGSGSSTSRRGDDAGAGGPGRAPDRPSRRAILKATTLATLAEVPDADARGQLDRWIAADPADLDAQVARLTGSPPTPTPATPTGPPGSSSLRGSSTATPTTSPPAKRSASRWPTRARSPGAGPSSTAGPRPRDRGRQTRPPV